MALAQNSQLHRHCRFEKIDGFMRPPTAAAYSGKCGVVVECTNMLLPQFPFENLERSSVQSLRLFVFPLRTETYAEIHCDDQRIMVFCSRF